MHEPTNPLVITSDAPMRSRNEGPRMAPSQAPSGNVPGSVERSTGAINGSDATSIHGHKCRKCGGAALKKLLLQHCPASETVRFVIEAEAKAAQEATKARRKSDKQSASDAQGGLL